MSKSKSKTKPKVQIISQGTIQVANNVSALTLAISLGYQPKQSGSNHFICCPVHNEDTPSLNLHQDGFFRCHGQACGIKGRALDFYMYHKWGSKDPSYFLDAVKGVCDVMGIPIQYEDGSNEHPFSGRSGGRSQSSNSPENKGETRSRRQIDRLTIGVYKRFIEKCSLFHEHQAHLMGERKISREAIRLREYRSFPEKTYQICKELSHKFTTFEGVPGFMQRPSKFRDGDFYWDVIGTKGILIPVRNESFETVGFQIRVDHPEWDCVVKSEYKDHLTADLDSKTMTLTVRWDGNPMQQMEVTKPLTLPLQAKEGVSLGIIKCKPRNKYKWLASGGHPGGSPAIPHYHVAVPTSWLQQKKSPKKAKSVWVTEGMLKGDIASEYTQCPFVCIPGVSMWRLAVEGVLTLDPEEVVIAIDADALKDRKTNRQTGEIEEEIGGAILGMTEAFAKAGKKVKLAAWKEEDAKGIDDLFTSGKKPQVFTI